MSDDLVVLGGGLAAYTATLAAASERPNSSIQLLCTANGQFSTETGLIDLLGYPTGGTDATTESGRSDPIADPFSVIDDLPGSHPYSQLSLDTIRDALSLFDQVTGSHYRGHSTEQNALFPTAVGNAVPAIRYPSTFAAGNLSRTESMRLVGFSQIPDFDAAFAADKLNSQLPYDVEHASLETALQIDEVPVAPAFAEALEDNTETEDGQSARRAIIEALQPELDVEPRVGIPAILGIVDADWIRDSLTEQLTAEVFEVPIGPPSLPGQRLEWILAKSLFDAGISVDEGVSVTGFEATDGEIESIETSAGTYDASSFVLAAGGLQGGGLVSTPRGISEPLFECPVSAPANRSDWVDSAFLGDHSAVQAGIETDHQLQPVDGQERRRYENLYAAGRILETPNVIAEHSASGIELVTGFAAGRRAIEH